jgi:hypothetical protein
LREELSAEDPSERVAIHSDSGCITATVFREGTCYFQEEVRVGHKNPALLLVDDHSFRVSTGTMNICFKHGIRLMQILTYTIYNVQTF